MSFKELIDSNYKDLRNLLLMFLFLFFLFVFRMKIVSQQRREMHDIQDIMFAMEEEWNELENEAKQDFQSLRDEIKNKVLPF